MQRLLSIAIVAAVIAALAWVYVSRRPEMTAGSAGAPAMAVPDRAALSAEWGLRSPLGRVGQAFGW